MTDKLIAFWQERRAPLACNARARCDGCTPPLPLPAECLSVCDQQCRAGSEGVDGGIASVQRLFGQFVSHFL